MNTMKILACTSVLLLLGGCASSHVQKGALIGALSGTALGAGLGYTLSEPELLGSGSGSKSGDTSLPVGSSTLAGAAIGLMVGGIVGAMVGHQRDEGYEEPKKIVFDDEDETQQSRAPYLRGL